MWLSPEAHILAGGSVSWPMLGLRKQTDPVGKADTRWFGLVTAPSEHWPSNEVPGFQVCLGGTWPVFIEAHHKVEGENSSALGQD